MFNIKKILKPHNIIYLLLILSIVYIIVGPWWISDTQYVNARYYKKTVQRLEQTEFLEAEGELYVGYAQKMIPVEVGQPIMGFSDRKPLESEGSLTPSFAKSLTVKIDHKAVTIVSVDVMILMGDIIDDIYKSTGLEKNEIFFTATHTHTGVGGWVKSPVFELFYGNYKQKYYDAFKNAIVDSILESRQNYKHVKLKYSAVDAGEWLENRIYKSNPAAAGSGFHGVNPYLTALSFVDYSDTSKVLYILSSYAAHATVIRKNVHKFSTDYPGSLCDNLKETTGATAVMFAAGSVGDARATVLHQKGVDLLGKELANKITPAIREAEAADITKLVSMYLPLDMPEARFSFIGPNWSVLPLPAKWLFDNPVHLSYLQLGEYVIVGTPVDMAGELTTDMQEKYKILTTSFNGSWKGYATKEDTYLQRDTYSTRTMGLAGSQAGEYLVDIAMKIYNKKN